MNNWQPQNPRSRFGAMYLKNSTANPVHLPQKWAKWAELAVLVTQNRTQNSIFSIAMDADYSFELNSIET